MVPTLHGTGSAETPTFTATTSALQLAFWCKGSGPAKLTPTGVKPWHAPRCTASNVDGENFDAKVGSKIRIAIHVSAKTTWEIEIGTFPA